MARKGVMLCYPFDERRLSKWNPPYIVQPKLNGLRCRAMYTEDGYLLYSSEANIFVSMPHIEEEINRQIKGVHADGELYQHGRPMTGPDGLLSIIKRDSVHPEHKQIEYHIFDIINHNENQAERYKRLKFIPFKHPLVHVKTFIANNFDDLARIYEAVCLIGYEGVVIRRMDAFYTPRKTVSMMKLKPHELDFYPIIGYKEEKSIDGYPKDRLGSVICIASNGESFSVGSGFDDDQRESFWKTRENLIGKFCQVKYQELTVRGVPWALSVADIVDKNPELEDKDEEDESSNNSE